jgi:trans-L-3-hydroxyproline dehydratase
VIHLVKTIDAHVGGQPLRLIVDGMPPPSGRTMGQKREWLRTHADRVRRSVVFEPRGHADMVAAVLTEAASPEAHAGIVFMDADGYPAMSGHGVIAAATIAVARDLFFSRDSTDADIRLVFDTPAGPVHTAVRSEGQAGERRVHSVAFTNVPAFVHTAAHLVRVGTRALRVDVAFAGMFFAIVDTEATGVPLRPERLHDLRRLGIDLQAALNAAADFAHPLDDQPAGIAGVIFTGPPSDPEAHLRSVVVTGSVVDRSPGGAATAAVMAVLDAMGLLADDQRFIHESITGTLFRGLTVRRAVVGETPALIAEVEGSAWITGEHTLLIEEDDPFREGLNLLR